MEKEAKVGAKRQTRREAYIESLRELAENDSSIGAGGSDYELIYIIEDVELYGGYELGSRSIDHNILLSEGITWEDILQWGIVIVPETESYISAVEVDRLEALGYERLGLDKNHIMGY